MASAQPNDDLEEWKTFTDMGLDEKLLKSMAKENLTEPTQIQQKVIVPMVKGHDVLIGDQAGSGKTVAINIALVQLLLSSEWEPKKCQALILSPTREVTKATHYNFTLLSESLTNLTSFAIFGGTRLKEDYKKVSEGVDVLFSTPGRLLDLMNRGKTWLDPDSIKILVLDEADELMTRGFRDQIEDIRKQLKDEVQVVISAPVVDVFVKELVEKIMRDPITRVKYFSNR